MVHGRAQPPCTSTAHGCLDSWTSHVARRCLSAEDASRSRARLPCALSPTCHIGHTRHRRKPHLASRRCRGSRRVRAGSRGTRGLSALAEMRDRGIKIISLQRGLYRYRYCTDTDREAPVPMGMRVATQAPRTLARVRASSGDELGAAAGLQVGNTNLGPLERHHS